MREGGKKFDATTGVGEAGLSRKNETIGRKMRKEKGGRVSQVHHPQKWGETTKKESGR